MIFLLQIFVPLYSFSQGLPDSLFSKVGFFEYYYPESGPGTRRYIDSMGFTFPRATYFFLKSDSLSDYWAITAKHVILNGAGHVRGLRMVRSTPFGPLSFFLYVTPHNSAWVFFHPDSLVDLAIIDQNGLFKVTHNAEQLKAFSTNDILTKREFQNLSVPQQVIFLALDPTSTTSDTMHYWVQPGTLDSILKDPPNFVDTTYKSLFKAEILLHIPSKRGVSGSPVFICINHCWRILGIMNGANAENAQCTPAYRILEAIKAGETKLDRIQY
jgi:hypothetical protein